MNADAIFSIGKTHTVCEDYARAGRTTDRPEQPGRTYAIVSDGCSSSPDTDFGSRFLTMAAIQGIDLYGDDFANRGEWAIWKAKEPTAGMLSTKCLDATLLAAYERDDGRIQVTAWGDGVIFAVERDGSVLAWEIEMDSMPSYLSYMLDPTRLRQYVGEGNGKRIVRLWKNGQAISSYPNEVEVTGDRTLRVQRLAFSLVFDPATTRVVGVASDGLMSFRRADTHAPVPLPEVIKHVTDIRVSNGSFIQRSSGFFLNKTCPKLGWQHTDDYSVAAIMLDDPETP